MRSVPVHTIILLLPTPRTQSFSCECCAPPSVSSNVPDMESWCRLAVDMRMGCGAKGKRRGLRFMRARWPRFHAPFSDVRIGGAHVDAVDPGESTSSGYGFGQTRIVIPGWKFRQRREGMTRGTRRGDAGVARWLESTMLEKPGPPFLSSRGSLLSPHGSGNFVDRGFPFPP